MDVKIQNGDIELENGGAAELISGFKEALQKIKIALTVPKESFIFDRSLGILKSGEELGENTKRSLDMLINECLVNSGCTVKLKRLTENNGVYSLALTIKDKFKSYETEVEFNG